MKLSKLLHIGNQVSNFYKTTLMVLKSSSVKQKLRTLNYHNYKFFNDTLSRKAGLYKQIRHPEKKGKPTDCYGDDKIKKRSKR